MTYNDVTRLLAALEDKLGIADAVRRCAHSISVDITRPGLQTIHFDHDGPSAPVVVATDGHRMTVARLPAALAGLRPQTVKMSKKEASVLMDSVLDKLGDEARSTDDLPAYPAWREAASVSVDRRTTQVVVDRKALLAALKPVKKALLVQAKNRALARNAEIRRARDKVKEAADRHTLAVAAAKVAKKTKPKYDPAVIAADADRHTAQAEVKKLVDRYVEPGLPVRLVVGMLDFDGLRCTAHWLAGEDPEHKAGEYRDVEADVSRHQNSRGAIWVMNIIYLEDALLAMHGSDKVTLTMNDKLDPVKVEANDGSCYEVIMPINPAGFEHTGT